MEDLWLAFGILAIVCAFANLSAFFTRRSPEMFRFLSLSFTALTLCSFYNDAAVWVREGDWSALEDVVPTVSGLLWVLVLASILLNGVTMLPKEKK